MREHGILRRVLLVYDEAARRLAADDATVMSVIGASANIVHRFVEGYHEKLEEEFVFPKLEKGGNS
jgi:hemerythrin-like domain-containing protein